MPEPVGFDRVLCRWSRLCLLLGHAGSVYSLVVPSEFSLSVALWIRVCQGLHERNASGHTCRAFISLMPFEGFKLPQSWSAQGLGQPEDFGFSLPREPSSMP